MTDNDIKAAIIEIENRNEADDKKNHATYGASTAERWVNCHGSVALSRTVPKRPAGPAAREGSIAHLCFEILLKNKENALATKTRLRKFFPPDMVGHCFEAFEHVVAGIPPGAILYSEQRVDSSSFTTRGQFGTVDVAVVEEFGRLRVKDFKYGQGIAVEVKDNLQQIYYALAISKKFHHNFVDIELEVIQPRAQHADGKIRSHVMTMDDLLAHEEKFLAAVRACEAPAPAFNPGQWCKWCDAKIVCKAIGKDSFAQAKVSFDAIKDDGDPPAAAPIDVKELPSMLAAFYRVELYIAAVREYAQDLAVNGAKIPGFTLVDRFGVRKWSSEKVATQAKRTWGALAFSPPELLSPAQLEKVLGVEFDQELVNKWVERRTVIDKIGVALKPVQTQKKTFPPITGGTKRGTHE